MEWPDAVDEVLTGDQVVGFAYVTPASGVVLLPLTNMGLSDRAAGTVEPVSSSVGAWKKLERIRRDPQVAVAYHTREHGFSDRSEYVLVQGRASLSPVAETDWVERHLESWERFAGPVPRGPLAERWLHAFHWRVGVQIAIERIAVWPDLACAGAPEVHGAPLPQPPAPHRPPGGGTAPRIRHRRAARRAAALPNVLLGWVGADGFPMVVPVGVRGIDPGGILLDLPPGGPTGAGDAGLPRSPGAELARGGRRAGLLAHSFARYTFGQHKRAHTGWVEAPEGSGPAVYAPHTESGYRFPESRLLFRLVSGAVTTAGVRRARRAGYLPARGAGR
jgi:hypothetical protein